MDNLQLDSLVESDTITHTAGKTFFIKKDFLQGALTMQAPVVRRMFLRARMNLDISAGDAAAKGGLLTHFLAQVMLKDASGQRYNVSGAEMRLIAQNELGFGYEDPDDLTASQTDVDVEFYIPFVLNLCDKSDRTEDSGMNLRDFLTGGECQLFFDPNTEINGGSESSATITINSGSWSLCAEVVDEGTPEVKSRLAWLSQSIVVNDTTYPINGKLRACFIYVGPANEEDGADWGTTPDDTLESRSFNYLNLPQSLFTVRYLAEGYHDPQTDLVKNNFAIPVKVARRNGKITEEPVFDDAHIKFTQTVPVGGTVVTGVWTTRSAKSIALAFPDVAAGVIKSQLASGDAVVPTNKGGVPLSRFPSSQRAYMPVRLASPKVADGSASTPAAQAVR